MVRSYVKDRLGQASSTMHLDGTRLRRLEMKLKIGPRLCRFFQQCREAMMDLGVPLFLHDCEPNM